LPQHPTGATPTGYPNTGTFSKSGALMPMANSGNLKKLEVEDVNDVNEKNN